MTFRDQDETYEEKIDGIIRLFEIFKYICTCGCFWKKRKVHTIEDSLIYSSGESDEEAAD